MYYVSIVKLCSCIVPSGNTALSPPIGQPATSSEGAAALCQTGQAEPSSVSGTAWAAAPGHQHHLPSGLLRTSAGRQWERKEKDTRQVGGLENKIRLLTSQYGNNLC